MAPARRRRRGPVVAVRPGGVTGSRSRGRAGPSSSPRRRCPAPRRRRRRAAPQGPQGRRGLRRSCTRATRCGTGTTTSAPTSRACLRPGTARDAGRTAERAGADAARPARRAGRSLDEAPLRRHPRRPHGGHDVGTSPTARRPPRHAGRRSTRRPADRRVLVDDRGRRLRRARVLPRRPPARVRPASAGTTPSRRDTPWPSLDLAAAERTDLAAGLGPVAARARGPPTARRCASSPTTSGRRPIFRVASPRRQPVRLTGDDGAYTDVQVAPDGRRSTRCAPPSTRRRAPVRLDAGAAVQEPGRCPAPAPAVDAARHAAPRSTRPPTTARRSGPGWCCPRGPRRETPRPLLLWVHGGPLHSAGTPGRGAGTPGSWPPAATPCCCPTRRCPRATGRSSSAAAGATGAGRPTPT